MASTAGSRRTTSINHSNRFTGMTFPTVTRRVRPGGTPTECRASSFDGSRSNLCTSTPPRMMRGRYRRNRAARACEFTTSGVPEMRGAMASRVTAFMWGPYRHPISARGSVPKKTTRGNTRAKNAAGKAKYGSRTWNRSYSSRTARTALSKNATPFGKTSGPAKRTPGISAIDRWTPSASRQSRSTSMWRRRPMKTWNVWSARPPPLPTWAPMKRTRTSSPPRERSRWMPYAVSDPMPPLPPINPILSLLRSREHLFKVSERLGAHAIGREPLPGDRSRPPAGAAPERFVPQEAIDRLGEGPRVPGRDEERRDPVLDHAQRAGDRSGNDRFLERHGLDERVWATLHITREGDHRGPPQPGEQFRPRNRAEELDSVGAESKRAGVPTPRADPAAAGDDESLGPPKVGHCAEENGQSLPSEQAACEQDEPRFVRCIRLSSGRSKLIEGESIRNQRGRLEPRVVRPHDFLPDRVRDEEDMTNPIPIVEFDREERREDGQGRPLGVVQGTAVAQRAANPTSLSEDRRVRRHDGRARHRIRPEVGHLGVVDDQEVGAVLPDEIRPASLERSLKLEVVRHDAAPVGQGHGSVSGVEGRRLTAEDCDFVSRGDSRKQLTEIRPDSAPDAPKFRSGYSDLRILVPPGPPGHSVHDGRARRVSNAPEPKPGSRAPR